MPLKSLALEIEIDIRNPHNRRGRRAVERAADPPEQRRVPRLARLLALAIKFEGMVEREEVHDYADLARLGYVTRARLTQIMNLLLLAPDIQERILFSCSDVAERSVRRVVKLPDWKDQRNRLLPALEDASV